MTQKELAARRQGVPEWIIRLLRPEFECGQEVKERAERAVKSGVNGRWGLK